MRSITAINWLGVVLALHFLLFFPPSCGEIKSSQWKSYASISDVRRIMFHDGSLWIAGGGLTQYHIGKGEEKRFLAENGLISNAVYDVAIDRKNNTLWVATSDGLGGLDLKTQIWKSFDKRDGLSDPFVLSLSVYDQGEDTIIYMGTSSSGLYFFREGNGRINPIAENKALPDRWVSSLVIDSKRHYLWVSTANGIARYNLKTSRFEKDSSLNHSRISVKRISIDEETGDVFCLDYLGGLFHYKFSNKRFERLLSPNSNRINITDLFFDPCRKILWISSSAGIYGYKIWQRTWIGLPGTKEIVSSILSDPQSNVLYYATGKGIYGWKFKEGKSYLLLPNTPPFHNTVNAIFIDNEENCTWMGTDWGIAKFQMKNKHWSHFPLTSYPGERVLAFSADRNTLWFGTMYHGLLKMDRRTGKIEAIKGMPESATVNSIIRDPHSSKLWFGILGPPGGVYEYDIEKKEFRVLPHLSHLSVTSMVEDGEWIWVGTNRGVAKFSKVKGPSEATLFEDRLFFDDVLTLALDTKRGHLWVTTEWGVKVYDKIKKEYKAFTAPEGYLRVPVTAILFDGDSIWLGSEGDGLSVYKPDTGFYQNMTTANGLASNFIISLAVDQRTGMVWAGTVLGGISAIEKRKK